MKGLAKRKLRGYRMREARLAMCCWTHADRDARDTNDGIDVKKLRAETEEFRCRCEFGNRCFRRATGEDMRCDWCRQIEQPKVAPPVASDWRPGPFSGHTRYCETGTTMRSFTIG